MSHQTVFIVDVILFSHIQSRNVQLACQCLPLRSNFESRSIEDSGRTITPSGGDGFGFVVVGHILTEKKHSINPLLVVF